MTVDEGVDISKNGDRGVLKRITTEGTGPETPSPGCKVTVHYTGTLLDGTKFDSSKDRNEPFQFTLGKDSVIKAWEIGIATMKKGEVCVLTCAPEYAYGAGGSPPKIPPNSTLQFEIEMIEWGQEDLSPGQKKEILRSIIEQGKDMDNPNDGALVTVELEGTLPDGKVFDKRTVTFNLGEGSESNICEGVEKALKSFLLEEKSKLTIAPRYAFKAEGDSTLGVPPNTTVQYIVKLVSFEKSKESWAMDTAEKLEQAAVFKEKGTNYLKANKLQLAIKMYKRVISLIEDELKNVSTAEDLKKQVTTLLVATNLNLALVYLKLTPPNHLAVVKSTSSALEFEPDNVKGLFRRGQGYLGIKEPELAMEDFSKVLKLEPENKAASNQVIMCKAALQKQKAKEKKLYADMFDKFAKHDSELEMQRARAEVDVIGSQVGEWGAGEGEWTDQQRDRKPTEFEKENPNILLLDKDGQLQNM